MFLDHFVLCPVGARRRIERVLFDLRPGVTEVYLHPGIDTDELRAAYGDWAGRVEDHAYLCEDPSLRDLIGRAGVQLIGYRRLRELQRAGGPSPDGLARLVTAALPDEGLTAADLETCCYGPDTEILGDRRRRRAHREGAGGLAAAWLVLLVVHPDHYRRGRGRGARRRERGVGAAGAVDMHLGTVFPRYVWPGVDFRFTAALALFEATGFEPYGAAQHGDPDGLPG